MPERHLGHDGWMEELNDEAAENAERKTLDDGRRPRDELWDMMDKCFGPVRTKSERGRRNRAVVELRAADVTPEELKIAYNYCRSRFTHFTEIALCSWLSRALYEKEQEGERRETFIRLLGKEDSDGATSAGDR